jgi:hypothetical protein
MDNEIQLISDGDGLAVFGDPTDVERFLVSEGLQSRDLELLRLGTLLRAGSIAADTASAISASSGRWVQLSEKTVRLMETGNLMTGSGSGLSRGVVQGPAGTITGIVEFAKGPASFLANPAVLAGAAGIMAQMAMKQSMDEITDYLATIDEKVDDVLRAQKDAVLADMIGVDFVIEEAMTVRNQVGRVSEVTWSKVQGTALTVARTQAYVLRQLDALAEKLESKSNMDDLAKTSKLAELKVQGWLAVLARCFQLQDALAVLELDRVLDAAPDELDQHRLGLRAARQNRLELITRSTERLMARMDAAADKANERVLLHPIDSRAVVRSTNHVGTGLVRFQESLGIESGRTSLQAKRWMTAAVEMKDQLVETGSDGVDAAGRLGGRALGGAKSVAGSFSTRVAEKVRRKPDGEPS